MLRSLTHWLRRRKQRGQQHPKIDSADVHAKAAALRKIYDEAVSTSTSPSSTAEQGHGSCESGDSLPGNKSPLTTATDRKHKLVFESNSSTKKRKLVTPIVTESRVGGHKHDHKHKHGIKCGHQAVWHKPPGAEEGHLDWVVAGSNRLMCSHKDGHKHKSTPPAITPVAPHISCGHHGRSSVDRGATPHASSSARLCEPMSQGYLVRDPGSSQAKLVRHTCGGLESGCPYEPSLVSHAMEAAAAFKDLHPPHHTPNPFPFVRSRCNSCSSPNTFSTEFEMPDCWEFAGEVTFLDDKDLQEALLLM